MFVTASTDKIYAPNSFDYHNNNSRILNYEVENVKSNGCIVGDSHQVSSLEHNYPCPKCNKTFKRGDHLKRHLLSVHDQDHPYHCGDCPKGFPSVDSLSKHSQTSHSGICVKGPFCAWCGVRFSCVAELENHANFTHEKQDADYMEFINKTCKVYGCRYCQKTVSSEKILLRHIEKIHSIHNDERNSCKKSVLGFSSAFDLEMHNRQVHNVSSNDKSEQNCLPVTAYSDGLSSSSVDSSLHYDDGQTHCNSYYLTPKRTPTQQATNPHSKQATTSIELYNQLIHQQTVHSSPVPSRENYSYTQNKIFGFSHGNQDNNPVCKNGFAKVATIKSASLNSSLQHREASTVSEALSLAMNALSEFSYDDLLCHSYEYVPAGFSVFRSSSPLPNFHYPTTVQLSNLTDDAETDSGASNGNRAAAHSSAAKTSISAQLPQSAPAVQGSQLYAKTVCPPSNGNGYSEQLSLPMQCNANQRNANGLSTEVNGALVDNHLQARRGRPKKRKTDGSGDLDDYCAQTMILKLGEENGLLRFKCTECELLFQGVDDVMRHIETVHLSANPQECCLCKKRFAQAGNVKRHIRFVHLRERPFQCSDCESTFDRLCYLQRHMRSHFDMSSDVQTGAHLLPTSCPECGKQCLTGLHLRGHMKRRHFAKKNESAKELMKKYQYLFDGDKIAVVPKMKRRKSKNAKSTDTSQVDRVNQIPSTLNWESQQHDTDTSASSELPQQCRTSNGHTDNSLHSKREHSGEGITQCQLPGDVSTERHHQGSQKSIKVGAMATARTQKDGVKLSRKRRANILPFKCRWCFRGFPSLCFFKSHVAVAHHRTTRRHLCHRCGSSYSAKLALLSHMTKRHGR